MRNVKLFPYNAGSASAAALAAQLGVRRIRTQGSSFVPTERHVIINWGRAAMPPAYTDRITILNRPEAVARVSNKLRFFESFRGTNTAWFLPPHYTTREEAQAAMDGRNRMVARSVLNGHSGEGITIHTNPNDLPQAPLYTLYIPKQDEYRIHMVRENGGATVFDVQRKAKREEVSREDANWEVRNLAGGFVYVRNNVAVPDVVIEAAQAVFLESYLDFGAVDVIYNLQRNAAYVLEINTAPGLIGTTLTNYTEALQALVSGESYTPTLIVPTSSVEAPQPIVAPVREYREVLSVGDRVFKLSAAYNVDWDHVWVVVGQTNTDQGLRGPQYTIRQADGLGPLLLKSRTQLLAIN